jgi:hypothetical protein
MGFYRLAPEARAQQLARVMRESAARFTHAVTAQRYIEIYERMLRRSLVREW